MNHLFFVCNAFFLSFFVWLINLAKKNTELRNNLNYVETPHKIIERFGYLLYVEKCFDYQHC